MAYKQDNVTYYGLDFKPKNSLEALEALKKIQDCQDAFKPDVALAALKYFNVVTNGVSYCNWRLYLTGEVYGKMAVLAGSNSKTYLESQGYINAFYVALSLMIDMSELYFQNKEKFDQNVPRKEILRIK